MSSKIIFHFKILMGHGVRKVTFDVIFEDVL